MRKKEDRRVEDVPVEEDRRVMERRSPENRKKPHFKRKGKGPDRRVQEVPVENDRRVGARRPCGRVNNWTDSMMSQNQEK